MRIGYPCINRSIGCTPSRTFRLASYSDDRLRDTVKSNLSCLAAILKYNVRHGLLFLRITSDLIPFASHPVCTFPWERHFLQEFQELGRYMISHGFRISLHPDQFVLLNTPDPAVLQRSIRELEYHARILNLLGLGRSAKIQIHVGGVYGDRSGSIQRFIRNYGNLEEPVLHHLVIENDERHYALSDCMQLHRQTGIPLVFDSFHHTLNNHGESMADLLPTLKKTWNSTDGIPMVDYSSQQLGKRVGAHTDHIEIADFRRFLRDTAGMDCDIMLEIKDKEKSALMGLDAARDDPRLVTHAIQRGE